MSPPAKDPCCIQRVNKTVLLHNLGGVRVRLSGFSGLLLMGLTSQYVSRIENDRLKRKIGCK